jgi:uncharacterized membrane protein YozB (DUF420 family)
MMDVVTLGMVAVVPLLAWSLYLVKARRAYASHGRIQKALGLTLLVVVTLFELEVRFHGWREQAKPSPYFGTVLFPVLYVHLFFAVSTSLLWIYTLAAAWRGFGRAMTPGPHSPAHRRVAPIAAAGMFCTAVTGWLFYYLAFVAG